MHQLKALLFLFVFLSVSASFSCCLDAASSCCPCDSHHSKKISTPEKVKGKKTIHAHNTASHEHICFCQKSASNVNLYLKYTCERKGAYARGNEKQATFLTYMLKNMSLFDLMEMNLRKTFYQLQAKDKLSHQYKLISLFLSKQSLLI